MCCKTDEKGGKKQSRKRRKMREQSTLNTSEITDGEKSRNEDWQKEQLKVRREEEQVEGEIRV